MGAFQEQVSKKRRGQEPYTDRARVGRQQVRISVRSLLVQRTAPQKRVA